jgi:hypothetical protein
MNRDYIAGGYILLARKIFESVLMDKPPLWLALWVWMLCRANFKDRDKLKRGQFVTTILEMQEAMSYQIGYRKKTPTRDQIRNAYEAFVKATMITTTKTTRGMIITICNYNIYQNPKNYEGHTEDHNENTTKPQVTSQDTERRRKERKKKGNKTFVENSIEFSLSKLLLDQILLRNPKFKKPNLQNWSFHIDRALRIDKRTPDELKAVILWCQKDDFWRSNILSTAKLREKFDQLFLKMNSTKPKKLKRGPVIESSLKPPKILTAEEIEAMNRAN